MYIVTRITRSGSTRHVWCEAPSAVEAVAKVQRVWKDTKLVTSVIPAEWVK